MLEEFEERGARYVKRPWGVVLFTATERATGGVCNTPSFRRRAADWIETHAGEAEPLRLPTIERPAVTPEPLRGFNPPVTRSWA